MEEINIIISSRAARGKSTVAEQVRRALVVAGLNVELIDDNGTGIVEELPGVIAGRLNESLAEIANRNTKVIIRTAFARRPTMERERA